MYKIAEINEVIRTRYRKYLKSSYTFEAILDLPKKENSLSQQIDVEHRITVEDILVNYDTFVITFDGSTKELIAFDVYKNINTFIQEDICLPENAKNSKCRIEKDEIRITMKYTPIYSFDNEKSIIKVEFFNSAEEIFYKIADYITVGFTNNEISSIYFEKITIE